jgi:hypothetical protein
VARSRGKSNGRGSSCYMRGVKRSGTARSRGKRGKSNGRGSSCHMREVKRQEDKESAAEGEVVG